MDNGYFVENGDVLENKLGISDPRILEDVEYDITARKSAKFLFDEPLPTVFDLVTLKNIHKYLFGEIYPFAGEIRTVNIAKPDSSIPFCYADFIETEAERIFKDLADKSYLANLSRDVFIDEIAKVAVELNALHPFREGNGRTIRLFLSLLAERNKYCIDYGLVSHKDILSADKAAFAGDNRRLRELYRKIIS